MQPNGDGLSRMDRVERVLEMLVDEHAVFQEEHKQLLKAQVVLTDRIDKLAIRMDELAESQQHTDQRLSALIDVVDEMIRNRPPQRPQ